MLDEIELLRRVAEMAPPLDEEVRSRLRSLWEDELLSSASRQAKRGVRPWRRAAIVIIPAALIVTGATYAVLRTAEKVASGTVTCFDEASLDSGGSVVEAEGRSPVAICAEEWAQGQMPRSSGQVPRLVACSMPGTVGVFPADDGGVCEGLGLAPLPPEYEEAAARFAALRAALVARFPEGECASLSDARRITRGVLDEHGFNEWDVRAVEPSRFLPCARPGYLDSSSRVAVLHREASPGPYQAVSRALERSGCSGEELALRSVREELDAAGFSDWSVEVPNWARQGEGCFTEVGSIPREGLIQIGRMNPNDRLTYSPSPGT
jgi:hypothetical protein